MRLSSVETQRNRLYEILERFVVFFSFVEAVEELDGIPVGDDHVICHYVGHGYSDALCARNFRETRAALKEVDK